MTAGFGRASTAATASETGGFGMNACLPRTGPGRLQAEVLAQRRPLVLGAERAALLQQGHDAVGEAVEPAGRDVGDEDETVAGARLDVLVQVARDGLR